MAKAKYSAIALLVCVIGCSRTSPIGPTTLPTPAADRTMSYDINIPVLIDAQTLKNRYPNGVQLSPIAAQGNWNYTNAYGGSPNVYFGPVGPQCEYVRAGIVVAPARVAGMDRFTATDWPGIGLDVGVTYAWEGHFVFTPAAQPGTYVSVPTGALCSAPPHK